MPLTNDHLEPFDPTFDTYAFLRHTPRARQARWMAPIIQAACSDYNINPRFVLAKLQHEQGLIFSRSPSQRAFDWAMGYGCPDSGARKARYRGFRKQVRSACWQVRRYLTRGLTVTAAFRRYTTDPEGIAKFLRVWHLLFGNVVRGGQVMHTNRDVADVARRVCAAHAAGRRTITIGKVSFNLAETGGCARFVRECHEAALGLAEHRWEWRAPSAACMEHNLVAHGKAIETPAPGDIVGMSTNVPRTRWDSIGWQREHRRYGHIGIYVGDGEVAENTSRRHLGTVITPLATVASRVTGYYRVLPTPDEAATRGADKGVVVYAENKPVACSARLDGDTAVCAVRPIAEALGWRVANAEKDGAVLRVYLERART